MRRAHRTAHLALWVILLPVMAITGWAALAYKPDPAENAALPAALIEEAS
ncbi:hypothetical protein [Maricaulis sp.]|nr:hypothetical protein [Maricaulis sp.]